MAPEWGGHGGGQAWKGPTWTLGAGERKVQAETAAWDKEGEGRT